MKKYSIVGLSLLAVSAVAAAFTPSKESNKGMAINGIRDLSTGQPASSGDITCRTLTPQEIEDEVEPNCSWTQTGHAVSGLSSTSVASNDDSATNLNTGFDTDSLTTAAALDS